MPSIFNQFVLSYSNVLCQLPPPQKKYHNSFLKAVKPGSQYRFQAATWINSNPSSMPLTWLPSVDECYKMCGFN